VAGLVVTATWGKWVFPAVLVAEILLQAAQILTRLELQHKVLPVAQGLAVAAVAAVPDKRVKQT
jgi:hypothetical protein